MKKKMNLYSAILLLITIDHVHTLVSIGANMCGLSDYGRSLPYVNLIRQSRQWGSSGSPWDGNCTFDPITGWSTQDFGVVIATNGIDHGGAYQLYAKGNATIKVIVQDYAYISDQTYDATTNTLSAIVNIPQGTNDIFLGFHNTTGPGLQDIVFLQPGYNLSSKLNISKLMLAHLSRFSVIRTQIGMKQHH